MDIGYSGTYGKEGSTSFVDASCGGELMPSRRNYDLARLHIREMGSSEFIKIGGDVGIITVTGPAAESLGKIS